MENTIKEILELHNKKSKEYKSDVDITNVYRKAAELRGISICQALDYFRLKHEISIIDMLNDDQKHTKDKIREKFNDYIIYTIILYEISKEEPDSENFLESFIESFKFAETSYDISLVIFKAHSSSVQRLEYNLIPINLLISSLINIKNYMLEEKSVTEKSPY